MSDARLTEAVRLLEYVLHLRMYGERAPGGDETWAEVDQRIETFLRSLPPEVPSMAGEAREWAAAASVVAAEVWDEVAATVSSDDTVVTWSEEGVGPRPVCRCWKHEGHPGLCER